MVNLKTLKELRTKEEVLNYFKQLDKEITEEEIDALKQSYNEVQESNEALTLEQLDDVAGGISVHYIAKGYIDISKDISKMNRKKFFDYIEKSYKFIPYISRRFKLIDMGEEKGFLLFYDDKKEQITFVVSNVVSDVNNNLIPKVYIFENLDTQQTLTGYGLNILDWQNALKQYGQHVADNFHSDINLKTTDKVKGLKTLATLVGIQDDSAIIQTRIPQAKIDEIRFKTAVFGLAYGVFASLTLLAVGLTEGQNIYNFLIKGQNGQ